MKRISIVAVLLAMMVSGTALAYERQSVWPKGKMPDQQSHQIAAMTDEASEPGFKPEKHRTAYLEWFEKPANPNGACMILISGGSYECCCDVGLIDKWHRELTALGIQCVNFVYRTPRPVGLPIYQTAWEDGQRAVRMVRSQAAKRGFDPDKIGVISMSAGSHLALLLATSSLTPAYERTDALDDLPCNINWAIVNAPAYVTSDACENGSPSVRQGYGPEITMDPAFKFDEKTCPMSLHHGENDVYSPNGSTLVYRQLRRMGIPAELHLYADMPHGAFGFDRAVEFMNQMEFYKPLGEEIRLMDRFGYDVPGVKYEKQSLWPEGRTPDFYENQNEPFIEWYIPEKLTTTSIQIIYAGGAYYFNYYDDFEVAPTRKYLNEKGMAVVVLKYRAPRPEGLPKHISAWQDLQRAIRMVRSQAAQRGLNPDSIGLMGSSAGGHLTLMGVTSSLHQSYLPIDETDRIPCNVQWGVGIYPAYVLTDGANDPNVHRGNDDSDIIVPDFSFDLNTAPMVFIHGDADEWSAMNSVKLWEKMRAMGIQCDLHTLAKRHHCFHERASEGTGSYTYNDRIWDFLVRKGFVTDSARTNE